MKSICVAVLGAGPAGLSTALAVARAGHRVLLVERDPVEVTSGEVAFHWPRKGVAHFLLPHAFNPRGRREIRTHLPDVYATLLDAGAEELDLRRRLPGPSRPGDEDLVYLGVRRPLTEWALRKAVLAQPEIELLPDTRVLGLLGDSRRVEGARTEQGELRADLVVDALGRTSPAPAWLAEIGASPPALETSDCNVLYYTRYYRVRHGETLPDGPWIPTPRGLLPYCLFSSFPGDNRTFGALLAILPRDSDLKILRRVDAFEAAVAAIPSLHSWTSRSEPITDVLAGGGLQNSLRRYRSGGRRGVPGLVPVGDALCHTNPMFALGLSQSLIHAFALATALADASRLEDVPETYHLPWSLRPSNDLRSPRNATRPVGAGGEGSPSTSSIGPARCSSSFSPPAVPRLSATPTSSAPTSAGWASSTARPFWTTTPRFSSAWRIALPSSAPRGLLLSVLRRARSCWRAFRRLPD